MNRDLEDIIIELDSNSTEIINKFKGLATDDLNWKSSEERWSVGQCIDHLIITSKQYYPIIESIINGDKKKTIWENLPLWPSMIGKMIVNGSRPGTKRLKTFPVFMPSQSNISDQIFNYFITSQEKLKKLLEDLPDINISKTIITSPVSKYITYSLKDCLTLIVVHQKRHILQAEEVLLSKAQSENK